MNTLLNPNEALSLGLRELGSLLDDDALFLASLTTTHREAGLQTSTAQLGGLREIGAREGSPGLKSGDLSLTNMLAAIEGSVFIRGGALRSYDP
jgi:hypothetical protein